MNGQASAPADARVPSCPPWSAGHWIGGAWYPSGEPAVLRFNPATGEIVGTVAVGGSVVALEAIAAARLAFEQNTWAQVPRLRAEVLLDFAAEMEREAAPLAVLLAAETGKLLRVATGEIAASVAELRFYAGLARSTFGRMLETEPGCVSLIAPEAAGVAAIMVPWNAPVILLVRSLAPAIAAGCTVVVRPALQSALIHSAIMRVLSRCERLPPGTVNSFSEVGSAGAEELVRSLDVQVISFTGSSRVGKAIMAAASPTLKKINLELGGKAPAIVLADCNIEQVSGRLATESMILCGQQCTAISRILVHESRYDAMKIALCAALSALRLGPVDHSATDLGPLINAQSRDRLLALVERAAEDGRAPLQGFVPGGDLERGAYLSPTLTTYDDLASDYIQQELFGPIVNLERFSSDIEAVQRANATPFGLAASVWTADLVRAHRIARAIKAGTVWINDHNKLVAEVETGGYGDSGVGRLHGTMAMQEFQQVKHIYQTHGALGVEFPR